MREANQNRRLGLVLLAACAGAAAVAGVAQLVWHARLFAARASFPLDLEWMEGGTLMHAVRLAQGQGIYVEPSVDFIPFLYTPLYPATLAALSRFAPLGYALGRGVSIAAFAAALVVLVALALGQARGEPDDELRFVRGGVTSSFLISLAIGLAGAGAVAASFAFTGTFYDLVRADSLLLLLEAAALACAFAGRGLVTAAMAGVLVALAFFTKQTASIVGAAIGLGALVASWRRGLVFGVSAAAVLAGGALWLQRESGGWFWRVVFELHQSHAFRRELALVQTPLTLLRANAPLYLALAIVTAGLAFARQLRRRDAIPLLAALAGFAAACVGMGTQWAFDNAYIPAVYFPALAAAVLGARLAAHATASRRAGALGFAALAAVAPGVQSLRVGAPDVARWVPSGADRVAADRFLDTLRSLPGELFIPFHPYYAVLVGKRPYLHRMGVLDVAATYGRPRGLDDAIAQGRFGSIVLDWKSRPGEWPGLDARYHLVRELRDGVDAVRSFSGAETSPRHVFAVNQPPPPRPTGARVVADFDAGAWGDWSTEGTAFGAAPAVAGDHGFGRGLADSAAAGPSATGVLRSGPFVLDHGHLRFSLGGSADEGLRVMLLDGPETARVATPADGAPQVDWDVGDLAGRTVSLVAEDQSATGSMWLDEVLLYDAPAPAAQPAATAP